MLSTEQRNLIAGKLADFGNIAAGSLIFGTLLRVEAFAVGSVFLGLILLVLAYVFAITLTRQPS